MLKKELEKAYPGIKIHLESLSVDDTEKVAKLPDQLPTEFKDVDILVNNAGLALGGNLIFLNIKYFNQTYNYTIYSSCNC